MCLEQSREEPASVVDHIVPHRGDRKLFWRRSNWQALCKPHHDGAKSAQERSGIVKGTDIAGRPTDPGHLWNRSG